MLTNKNSDHQLQFRPKKLNQFIGQENLIKTIKIGLAAAKKMNKSFDHCLLYGPAGVGKTTLAHIIANEMHAKIKIIQGANINTTTELIGILNCLNDKEVIFIDEIHSMNRTIAELLYSVIEDNVLDIVIGKGYNSKVVRLNLPKFTLIAATNQLGLIAKPLEDRFNYLLFIDYYSNDDIKTIIQNNLKYLSVELQEHEIELIAQNSRGIPRNVNRILRQIYNYKITNQKTSIKQIIKESGFIINGLREIDINLLKTLFHAPQKTLSLKTLSQLINLDEKTVIEKIEPYLIQSQYIIKSHRGRKLTINGIRILESLKII